MITKQLNGFVGYGETSQEAETSCLVSNILVNCNSISKFDSLVKRFKELSPWLLTDNSLHISDVGYVSFDGTSVNINGDSILPIGKPFQVLYNIFSKHASILDLALCQVEINQFFNKNNITKLDLSKYSPISYEIVDLQEDIDIKAYIMTDKYSFIDYDSDKVGVKLNSDDYYWTCSYDSSSSFLDSIFYIAYSKGYLDIHEYVGEGF